MPPPRVLTFNFHEPYLCLMAKTGLTLHVGQYESGPLRRPWFQHYRPKPPNIVLVPERQWRADLMAGKYDVVIAHNENNALNILEAPVPKLLVCHNRKTFLMTTATTRQGDARQSFAELIERLQQEFEFVFISESKKRDYSLPGRVILPGIDIEEFGGYSGAERRVLRVGNMMRERDLMFDVDFQEQAVTRLPNVVVGENPGITDSKPASSFDELLWHYRNERCLLHVTRQEYEDGYNLVMLEAMAAGMPVVALANETSPITDGVDGFAAPDAATLRNRLVELLENQDLAREIGARGRETVARAFPIEAFVERWREAIFVAAERHPRRAKSTTASRERVLLHYMASPITTGRYFERALRERCDVVTAGFRAPEEVLELWGFGSAPPPYPPHDINLPLQTTWAAIRDGLPPGFDPDLYFWIDSGPKSPPDGLDAVKIPKVAYLIDSHVAPDLRLSMAKPFDCVFLAQKAQVETFREAGVKHVFWMPLACSPELHDTGSFERTVDVAYVGSFSTEEDQRRPRLLEEIRNRYPNHYIGKAWPEDMARIYARSKIVVNACVNHDVNMRVFEAMASGALLITDTADGLEDLFRNGEHLVIYRSDSALPNLIDYYFKHPEERERIARQGQELVLREHTYAHRVEEILRLTRVTLGLAAANTDEPEISDYYECARPEILPHVPLHARRVLDVGCGAGAFSWTLKRYRPNIEISGIEIVPAAAEKARRILEKVIVGNIEEMELPFESDYFDCIVCADVLEHLKDPVAALRKLARVLAPDGVIVISIPNVHYFAVLDTLSQGRWPYMDRGILDRTHLRFFCHDEIAQMIRDAGLEVGELAPLNFVEPERCRREEDGAVRLGKVTIENVSDDELERLRVYQYRVLACKPGEDRLRRAQLALDAGKPEAALALALNALAVDECARRRIAARACVKLGQLTKAETYYREALELRADADDLAGELGILLVAMNRTGEARELLERARAANPENGRVIGALGLASVAEDRPEEAYSLLKQALETSFDHTSLLSHFTALAERLNRIEVALPLMARFADFYPGNLDLALLCADWCARLGRTGEARDRLESVLLLQPGNERAQALMIRLSEGK